MYCDVYTSALSAVATAIASAPIYITSMSTWNICEGIICEGITCTGSGFARMPVTRMLVTPSHSLLFYIQWPSLSKDKQLSSQVLAEVLEERSFFL